jgi:N-succinyldiaminopimelate aminotransferase
VVFHSLSKRSNLPGMRSGFVAGDAAIMERFLLYRTYQGCALPLPTQWASIAAWSDENHVRINRALYREKFTAVLEILAETLQLQQPEGGFYLWPQTPVSDTEFASGLYAQQHLTVLPGSFLGRDGGAGNPGDGHVRLALVAPLDQCIEAAHRIRHYCEAL